MLLESRLLLQPRAVDSRSRIESSVLHVLE